LAQFTPIVPSPPNIIQLVVVIILVGNGSTVWKYSKNVTTIVL
jgi:hypothetical protein